MSNLVPFDFNNNTVSAMQDSSGEVWFVAKDIADVLEYSDAFEMTKKLDSDEVQNRQIAGFGNRGVNLINESGLYTATLSSKKPAAKEFKKWVTSEVLPTLRKTGTYSIEPAPQPSFELQMAEVAARMLRMSDTSKIRMLAVIADNKGIQSNFLPSYTDESLTRALGDLLRESDIKLSAVKANPILCEMGLLEKLSRRSTSGTYKDFWSITDKGLRYGKNETSPSCPNQTQPRWYVSRFDELLAKIEGWV